MITAGDVVLAVEPVTPMQTAGLSAPRFGADAGGVGRTNEPARGASPAAAAGGAFICSRRPEVALGITGQAWRAPTGAARPRRIDGADVVAAHFADPGAPMQQM